MGWASSVAIISTGGAGRGLGRDGVPRDVRAVGADLLAAARERGCRRALLVGGEPTLRGDLSALLGLGRRVGLETGFVTDGRDLRGGELLDALAAGEASAVRIRHHAVRELHDRLEGQAGAFEESLAGLGAALLAGDPGLEVDLALTVTAEGLAALAPFVLRVAALGRRARLVVRLVAPWGLLPEAEWPGPASLVTGLAPVTAAAAGAGVPLAAEGFPPCLLPPGLPVDETLRLGAVVLCREAPEGSLVLEPPGSRRHPWPCDECSLRPSCAGAPAAFLRVFGARALAPRRDPRANSFNFELGEPLAALEPKAGRCPLLQRLGVAPPSRELFLVAPGRTTRCETKTTDFDDATVSRVKDDLEQVYLDLGPGAARGDITARVRRLVLHGECSACPGRSRCPGAFVEQPGHPFEAAEQEIRSALAALEGRVLDVGCGDGRYRDLLAPLVAAGRVDYHGLDPDREVVAALRARGVSGLMHEGTLETFEAEPASFDAALLLRSWNHIEDLARGFEVLARLLRPGGRLLVVDSPPFALLRTTGQVAATDREARRGHEHYRNWWSEEVVAFLERRPFRLVRHRPVARQTSCQWLVEAVRRGPDPSSGSASGVH